MSGQENIGKVEASHVDDVLDAKEALIDAESSMLTNQAVAAEVFPFFSMATARLLMVCSAGYFCTLLYGYDGTVMSGVNIMPEYLKYFGAHSIGGGTGLIFSLFYAGAFIAVIMGYFLSDYFGRRAAMFVGAAFALVGAIIQASSVNIQQFRAARFLLGLGSWCCFSYGPIYTIEMALPQWRGRLGGLLMVSLVLSTIFAGWLNFACSYVNSSFAWRFPLAFQCVPPILCLSVCWLVPESPRWLVSRGRREEALQILIKYHGNGNPDSALVRLEYAELLQTIEEDGADRRWWDFREMVSNKANLFRSFVLADYGILVQWSGNSLGIYYLPVMFGAAGVKNYHISLLLTSCVAMGALVFAFVGTWLLDKWGRRNCLLFALLGMASLMAILTGLQWNGTPKENSKIGASVAMIIIFRYIYTIGLTPSEALYTIELLPYRLRAKGQAWASLISTAALFGSLYATPSALATLGSKYYLIYVGLDLMQAVIVYFFFPETKGKTIEEIDAVFNSANPIKASLAAAKKAKI
ncbi:general substrate transporter [Xylogone sp. PMI_703]|nr:general substrate transporter [Xylogone sp. PMI_703]